MSAGNDGEIDRQAAMGLLSPEELEALQEDDMTPEQRAAMEAIAADDEDDDDELSGTGDGSGTPVTASDDAGTGEGEAVGDDPGDDSGNFAPRFKIDVPEDLGAQVDTLSEQQADLARRFKSGDVESDEFVAENMRISKEIARLESIKANAELAQTFNAQTEEQIWARTVDQFIRKVKREEGIDYRAEGDVSGDFDRYVKMLAGDPKNNDKDYTWFLSQAHKATKALHGVATKAAETPDPKKAAAERRKPPVASIPATLAQVPGGDGPGDVDGEFADLDSLEGLEYETALARLTPAQRERYLAAA